MENEWPDTVTQQLNEVIQLDSNGFNHIWLQLRGSFQADLGIFETKWSFLNASGVELTLKNMTSLNLIARLMPLFFLSALRDASQEFGTRGQFWSGFLKSIQLPDEQREQVEEMLREVNSSIIGANTGLTEVTKKIADANQLVPLATDPVVLEAVPTRVFDMVGKIQVHLKSQYGAKLPLNRHGEGTQSLAVLMLFQAFAATNLAETYAPESTPLLALEEPEAHLHPSAIRSLGTFLQEMTGQIVITSHSGDLVSRIPVAALRRIYKRNGDTRVGQIQAGSFTERELQAIDYSIRLTKGYYLFSHCWLLVEGESKFHIMPLLIDIMGYSQDQSSISVLEFSQAADKGEPFMKLANELGIPWFLMADGDPAGSGYLNRANKHIPQGIAEAQTLANKNIEHEFWHNGFDDFIKSKVTTKRISEIKKEAANDQEEEIRLSINATINRTSYWAGTGKAYGHKSFKVEEEGANKSQKDRHNYAPKWFSGLSSLRSGSPLLIFCAEHGNGVKEARPEKLYQIRSCLSSRCGIVRPVSSGLEEPARFSERKLNRAARGRVASEVETCSAS